MKLRQNFKKGLSLLTAAGLIFSMMTMPIVSADGQSADENVLFPDRTLMGKIDFDDNTTEFTNSTNIDGISRIIESGDDSHGNVLELTKGENLSEGKYGADIPLGENAIPANTGKYLIEYDAFLKDMDQWAPYILLRTKVGWQSLNLSIIGTLGSGFLCTYGAMISDGWWDTQEKNPVEKIGIGKEQWMNVKIALDTKNGRADYYYDNVYVGSQTAPEMGNIIKAGISTLMFEAYGHGGYNAPVYLDNISVSKINPSAVSAGIINYNGELVNAEGTAVCFSKTMEILLADVASQEQLEGNISLTLSGDAVDYTSSFDVSSQKLTVTASENFEDGGEYVFTAFGKEFAFTVDYGEVFTVADLMLKKNGTAVNSIYALVPGDELTAEISILNTTGSTESVALVAAVYDGVKMKGVTYKTVTTSDELFITTDSLNFVMPACFNPAVKLYVFDNMTTQNVFYEGYKLGNINESQQPIYEISETEEKNIGKQASIFVYAHGKSAADLAENTEMNSVLYYIYQKDADETGTYTFRLPIDASDESGVYKAYTSCNGSIRETKIAYLKDDDNKTAVGTLKGITDKTEFVQTAELLAVDLGLGEYTDNIPSGAYELLYDYYTKNTADENDVEKNTLVAKQAEIISLVNSGEIINLFDHKDMFKEDTDRISKFYSESFFTENFEKTVTKAFKNEKVSTLGNVKEALQECFVLAAVKNPNGYENLAGIFGEFYKEIGIKEEQASSKAAKAVAGEGYADYPDLKKAITDALKGSSSSSGSSSGGGGGGGIKRPNVITTPAEPAVVTPEIPMTIFEDIASDYWASEAIVSLKEKGIINGKEDSNFCPEDNITREEFIKILVGAFMADGEAGEASFTDVDENMWYHRYIAIAYKAGLIKGFEDGSFGIGQNITRQDMAVMLWRVSEVMNYNFKKSDSVASFDDEADIAPYALDAVYILRNAEIINGSLNRYNPTSFATRAEAAQIIYNMLSL